MKLFVTAAQEAAQMSTLRLEVVREMGEACERAITTALARHDAELSRVRADRREELERLKDPQGPFVAHLQDEVDYWRVQFERERQRAELAIDQCRVTHASIGPVSLPLRPTHQDTSPTASIFADPELAMMGHPDGVPG